MSDSDKDNEKRDRLAADRLRALRRHDLISVDGTLWWNSGKWEPIGLSLNYEVSSAEEMAPIRYRHGIERFPFLNLPSKGELQNAKSGDPAEAEGWANEIARTAEKATQRSQQLAQEQAPALQEAEQLIEAERRQRTAQKSEPSLGTISEDGTQEWDGEVWQRHLSYDGTKSFNGKEFVPLSHPLTRDEERRVAARLQRDQERARARRRKQIALRVGIGILWVVFLISFLLFYDANYFNY